MIDCISPWKAHERTEAIGFARPFCRVYEVDLGSGEKLRKNGLKIRLSGQPFQVLAMLLERPGEIITREELQNKLWPDGTFVDFDHSLNTAINKIREASGRFGGESSFSWKPWRGGAIGLSHQ